MIKLLELPEIKAKEAAKSITVDVRLPRQTRWRIRFALWLIRRGAAIIGAEVRVQQVEKWKGRGD